MKIEIKSITVVHRQQGTDIIWLETELPEACFPFQGTQTIEFQAAANTGEEYVRKNFEGVMQGCPLSVKNFA